MASAEPGAPAGDAVRSFLTFRVGGRLYALPAEEVVEVMPSPQFARVPHAPKALLGLANLRGSVVPLASLRELVGLDDAPERGGRAILLNGVAFDVDTVEALASVRCASIETRQAALAAEPREILSGAFPVEGKSPAKILARQAALAAEPREILSGAFPVEGKSPAKILDINALLERAFAQRSQSPGRTAVRGGRWKARQEAPVARSQALVTFDVAGQEYGLSLSTVREIVPVPPAVTAFPRADAAVVGIMPFREHLLPLLSLRKLLGFDVRAASDHHEKIIVAKVGNLVVGLVADRVRAIVFADQDLVEDVPAVLAARSGGEARIKAIYRGEGGGRLISILAPEQLFREDIMQRLGAPEDDTSAPDTKGSSEGRQFLVFRLGDDEFGLPVEAVDEVTRVPDKITRVPRTPKFLEGVINLRGEVLPVVDQRRRFEMPKADKGEARRLVVVRTERHRAGLIVDSVSEVLRSSADAIEPPPHLTGEITRLVHGVLNLERTGRMILLLDPAELLTRAEQGLLDTFAGTAQAAS